MKDKKERSVRVIITLVDYGDTNDKDDSERLFEMLSYLDASFSFNYKVVEKCYCDNGIFYFTKDNLLKDSKICGKCNGDGVVKYE